MAKDYSKYSNAELIAHIQELEKQLKNNKYGLYWDKSIDEEVVVSECKRNIPVLVEDTSKRITSNTDLNNVLIMGDNFLSLTCLTMLNDKKFDIIYIDPPYNTGNKARDGGFKYNDEFIDRENSFRHSKWLSFMKKRLVLAHSLLDEYGVMFVSIDDNELFNLKLLLDSIFGEKNFLGNIIQNKGNAQNDAKNIQKNHDYILCYAKKRKFVTGSDGKYKEVPLINCRKTDEKVVYKDSEGRFYYIGSGLLTGSAPTLKERIKLGYTIYYNPQTDEKIAVHDYDEEKAMISNDEAFVYTDVLDLLQKGFIKIRPPKKNGKLGRWTWSLDKFNSESDKIIITAKMAVATKVFVDEKDVQVRGSKMYYEKNERTQNIKSFYDFSSAAGTEILTDILGEENDFNNPKNVEMLKFLIDSVDKTDATVLDFFGGSGTTGQAVIELNERDGGSRSFVICTNNENNICEEITYPRLKTVITGVRNDGTRYANSIDCGLVFYRTDFVADSDNTDQAKYCLVEKIDMSLCILENIYDLVKRNDTYSHYTNCSGTKNLFVYYDFYSQAAFTNFKNDIVMAKGKKVVYIFTTNNSVDDTLLGGLENITVKPVPAKMYEIFKEIREDLKRGE